MHVIFFICIIPLFPCQYITTIFIYTWMQHILLFDIIWIHNISCRDDKIRTCARHYSMLLVPNQARLTGLLHIPLFVFVFYENDMFENIHYYYFVLDSKSSVSTKFHYRCMFAESGGIEPHPMLPERNYLAGSPYHHQGSLSKCFAERVGLEPTRRLITDLTVFKTVLFTNLSTFPNFVGMFGLEPKIFTVSA